MDDDDEDFRLLYFQECEDLVGALQGQLESLQNGGGDDDTIHAAFRAVHSVKGGAAAFGFEELINFAHTFEAVMDLARSDKIPVTPELCALLLRSSDTMEALIQRAQEDSSDPVDSLTPVLGELRDYLGEGGPSEKKAEAPAAKKEAEPAAKAEEPVEEELELEEERTFTIFLRPMPTFFDAGLDMLKIVGALKDHGMVTVELDGDVPPLETFSIADLEVAWKLILETTASEEDVLKFVAIYEATAEIEVVADEVKEPQAEEVTPAEVPAAKSETVEPEAAAKPAEPPKAEPEASKKAESGKSGGGKSEDKRQKSNDAKSLRIDLQRVDRLVNLVGEIAITQASLVQTYSESDVAFDPALEQTIESLTRQTRDLQDSVMAIRAQPVKVVFSRMPRVIRELSQKLGKKVRLDIQGELTEVDTTIIEELSEPLIHMLRNSMDHGLESPEKRVANGKPEMGTIVLKAEHRGERVVITVSDNGAGINREIVHNKAIGKGLVAPDEKLTPEDIDNLIFHPGFSTAESVSSVSGRGVGMDVVRKKIVELGGRCSLQNDPGKGATFIITLPLTLAVLDGMTVAVGEDRFILPLSNVVEATRLVSVRDAFNLNGNRTEESMAVIVDTETDGHVALKVDELIGQRQVVLKSIESNYKRVSGVSGATILGDGRVALILDVPALVEMAGMSRGPAMELLH